MKNMMKENKPITEAQLIEFEQYVDAKLPEDYRRFLLDCNGGYPDRAYSFIPEENAPIIVDYFYGIGDSVNDMKRVYDDYEGVLPNGFISIGDDPGGDEFILGLSESEHEGQVFFWLHDQPHDEEMENTYFISNSFNEFFDDLKEDR